MDDWHKFLGDAALTTAILDRLLHRSVLVEFRGKSHRLKEAASRLAKDTHSEQQSTLSCLRHGGI
jgi:DNA replication protein DnaC